MIWRPNQRRTISQFKGVHLRKKSGRYNANIKVNGKKIWLGSYENEIDAARAYDRAALKYHGEFARLNFPREDYINEIKPTQ